MNGVVMVALLGALLMGSLVVNGQSFATTGGDARASVETSGSTSVQISTSTTSKIERKSPEPKKEQQSPPKPPPKEDKKNPNEQKYNEIVGNLRNAWENEDVNGVANVLSSSGDVNALAEGLRFEPESREDVLEKSDDRDEDPDVVTIKGIAKSALDTGDVKKLAAVMVVSTLGKRDAGLEAELAKILSNRELMQAVLNADADKEFVPDGDLKKEEKDKKEGEEEDKDSGTSVSSTSEVSKSGGGSEATAGGSASASIKHGSSDGRRLLTTLLGRRLKCDGCSPANSLVCAHCWAKDVCAPFHWCP